MSSRYAVRDAILTPIEMLLRCALAHPALFETDAPRVERLILPCKPMKLRAQPLRKYSETEHQRFVDAAKDGYAKAASPLTRQFSAIPPVIAGRPFQLEITFKNWQDAERADVFLPVDIGDIVARVGGAEFRSNSANRLARDIVYYLERHRGLDMGGPLSPWYFDAPGDLLEHTAPYQGLLADTGSNAVSRLEAISKPVRFFIQNGGTLQVGDRNSDIAAALGIDKLRPRKGGVMLRV